MENRLSVLIRKARKSGEKLFCAFLTLGFPDISSTVKLMEAFEAAGVDVIELGFPFSDPLADGPTIQFSSECALRKGVSMEDAFRSVRRLRKNGARVPIVFFSYLNPIFHYGLKRFVRTAKRSGFDGLIVPDMPPEEEASLHRECRKHDLNQIFLVAPTTERKRARLIARRSEGFIYFVSLRGVTGARRSVPCDIRQSVRGLSRFSAKPILIGFGVSSAEQGHALAQMSQGVIVGSAIIDRLRRSKGSLSPTVAYIRKMVKAVKGKR